MLNNPANGYPTHSMRFVEHFLVKFGIFALPMTLAHFLGVVSAMTNFTLFFLAVVADILLEALIMT